MKPDIKDKWVTALRSDKYKQGDGHLRFTAINGVTTFCCLGVLCDVMGAEWIKGKPVLPDGTILKRVDRRGDYDTWDEFLSHETLEMIDLNAHDQIVLGRMNDDGKSFEIIADYIETEL